MLYPTTVTPEFFETLLSAMYPQTGPVVPLRNVQTWEEIGEVKCSSLAEGRDSVLRARAAFDIWYTMGAYRRSRILFRFLRKIVRNSEPLIGLTQILSGKSLLDAVDEYIILTNEIRGLKRGLKILGKAQRGKGAVPMSTYRVQRRPLGVVGVFTHRDAPIAAVSDVLNPIMAGNAVVNFVSPQVAPATLLMKAILMASGMPPDVWRIVISPTIDLGVNLVAGLDFVSMFGSTRACQLVSAHCAKLSVPMSFFGGRKNVSIVMDDAKLWDAAKACARSAFRNAGQSPNSVEVVFVQESVVPEFQEMLVSYTRDQIHVGRYLDNRNVMGALASPDEVDINVETIRWLREGGASILCGGNPLPDVGPTFFEPTILSHTKLQPELLEREFYGPIVVVVPFDDIRDVVHALSTSRRLHAVYLFTRDMELAGNFIDSADVATISINDIHTALYSSWRAPIQGRPETGMGIRHGTEAVLQYTRLFSAARLKRISWVPKDWRTGQWTERLTFFSMGLRTWLSRNVTNTVVVNAMKSKLRHLSDRFFDPV